MLPTFCTQRITRIRPGTKELRGSTVFDWSADKISELAIEGCSIQPAATTLSQDGRVLGISEGLTAYLPAGSDVKAGDRIRFEGKVYTINGDPKEWAAPFALSNMQLNLIRWEG